MRIAFIHPRFPSAEGTGATHSATQIVKGLIDDGHEVCVYCTRSPEKSKNDIEMRELNGNSRHPHTLSRLNEEINARIDELGKYDIVHSYLMRLMPSIAKVGKETNAGTVITLNAYGGVCAKNDLLYLDREKCTSKSTLKCLNCLMRTGIHERENNYFYHTASELLSLRLINKIGEDIEYIDRFRAPSDHVRDNYIEFGYDEGKINVIPHPINDDFLIPHQSSFREPYELLYVGSLEKHKGVEKLIPILNSLNKDGDEFRLTIIGTGGLEDKLREQARNYGIREHVNFAGFIPNSQLPRQYARHDCFVYPGVWEEPLGRVYLEALCTGTPIVTSDYGSIQTIIGGGGITTDGSIEDFHKAISRAAEEDRFGEMSRLGKQKSSDYKLDKVIEGVNEMYEQIQDG